MTMRRRPGWFLALAVVLVGAVGGAVSQPVSAGGAIKLVVRADDIGSCHTANLACIQVYREGIARSVEVQVPCPWFNEAARMLRENPGYDVGVHLTLTSEWENYKWGPLTQAPSLVDAQGHFFPMTSQRADFPPGTGFLESGWKIEEVEKGGWFGKPDWKLIKQPAPGDELLTFERMLLDRLFVSGDEVKLSELKNTFASKLREVEESQARSEGRCVDYQGKTYCEDTMEHYEMFKQDPGRYLSEAKEKGFEIAA